MEVVFEMVLVNNNHSVFKMEYKLFLSTNRLYPIIDKEIADRLKEIFLNITPNHNISLKEWLYQEDRIEIIFSAHPNTELSKFINAYKSASSRLIKKEYPQIVNILSKGRFWSRTFCLVTLDHGVDEKDIKEYIEKQS